MYTASITVDDVIDALADFIGPFASGAEVVRGQANRVPLPKGPCVVLTEAVTAELSVPTTDYEPEEGAADIRGPKRIDVQCDFYGPSASEQANVLQMALRNQWAYTQFPANVKPLHASDAMKMPLVDDQAQWANRWTLTASLQYNPVVTVPQQFADDLSTATVDPVDNAAP